VDRGDYHEVAVKSRRTFLTSIAAASATATAGARAQSQNLRIGAIGVGWRGSTLMREIEALDGADVVAIADIFVLRHQEARQIRPSIRAYLDHREMLAAEDLDVVVIATPQHLHAQHFVDALEAGAHVYVEKTMGFNLEHLQRMRRARERFPGQIVQVGIQGLSSGAAVDVPLMLADDKVGQITEIHANWYRNHTADSPPWVNPIPPQAPLASPRWDAFLGEAPPVPFDAFRLLNWRLFWDYSGGAVFELFVHQLGFWFKMLNLSAPDRVTSAGDIHLWKDRREVPDVWSVAMQFEERDLALHWTSSFGNRFLGVREYALGTRGTIEKIGDSVRYLPEAVTNPAGQEMAGSTPDSSHMQDFFDAIRAGREPSCPFETGFQTAVACRMAVDSLRQGRSLRWDRETERILPAESDGSEAPRRLPIRARSQV
jgi:predicted dehydrogenase